MKKLFAAIVLVILSSLPNASHAEEFMQRELEYNNWTISLGNRKIIFEYNGKVQGVLWLFQYRFLSWNKNGENIFTSKTYPGKNKNNPLFAVEVSLNKEGKLELNYTPLAGKSPDYGPTILMGLVPQNLAGSAATHNGKRILIPKETTPKRPWSMGGNNARKFTLFDGMPQHLGINVTLCKDTSIRDTCNIGMELGKFGFAFYLHPDKQSNSATLEFDLGAATGGGKTSPIGVRSGGTDPYMPKYKNGDNMVLNPGFEGGLASWGFINKAKWKLVPGEGRNGGACAQYTSKMNKSSGMLAMFPAITKPGKDYTLSFYAKSNNPKAKLCVRGVTEVWPVFAGGKSQFFNIGRLSKGKWKRFTFKFKAPGKFVRFGFGDHNAVVPKEDGMKIYLDDVQLVAGNQAKKYQQPALACYTETKAKNNVYFANQPAPVKITFTNTSANTLTGTAKIDIRDAFRNIIMTRNLPINLEANGKTECTVDLAKTGKFGLFSIRIATTVKGHTENFFGRVARVEAINRKFPFRYIYHIEGQPSVEEVKWRMKLGYKGSLSFKIAEKPELLPDYEKLGWKTYLQLA